MSASIGAASRHRRTKAPRRFAISTFVSQAAGRYGRFLYNPNDLYIGRAIELYGEAHELELEFLRSLCGNGDYVFDVGANIGDHAIPLALHVGNSGRVFAFEPQRVPFQMLCGNAALAELANVEAFQAALGSRSGSIVIPEIDYSYPANYGSVEVSRFTEGRPVPVRTLDEFADLPRIDLVKIDVEGMERDVLAGGTRAIEAFRPILYVENDREDKSAELIEFLQSLRYRMFWHLPPLFNPKNFHGNRENVFGPVVASNMLCVPSERPLAITGFREIDGPAARPFANERSHARLGIARYEARDLDGAAEALERAIALHPDDRSAAYNLGVVEDELGRARVGAGNFVEAERLFKSAAKRIPDRADPLANLTFLYHALGRLDEAKEAGEAAIAIEPDHVQSHVNLALTYLLAGDYGRGFREYERRPGDARFADVQRWDGGPMGGRRLLISREQGLGDFVLLSRFFPAIAERGAALSVEMPAGARELYAGFPGIDEALNEGDAGEPSRYAAYLPIGSIPGVLGIDPAAIPAPVPYLHAARQRVRSFSRTFARLGKERTIGIAWAGSPSHARDRHRSCALAEFTALADVEGVAWISLQKGPAENAADRPPSGLDLTRLDGIATLADTAAAISALDLVISVDTVVAHLAGALGKPVWLLNGFGNYWLWGLRQERTPWYPTMRQFHQDAPDDWASVFRDVKAALRTFAPA